MTGEILEIGDARGLADARREVFGGTGRLATAARLSERVLANGAVLLIDKPSGIGSNRVIGVVRRVLGLRKIGHAGTLDPLASGLLVLGAGPATRLITHLVGLDKKYEATIRLGFATSTDDSEGERLASPGCSAARLTGLARELAGEDPAGEIVAAVAALTGDIEQVPSSVSAIKVQGRRAYDIVRGGDSVQLRSRPVTVSRFALGEWSLCESDVGFVLDIRVQVTVSSGTYVRALARDLGEALGVGGHLTALRRSSVGPFSVGDASTLEVFAANPDDALMTPATAACKVLEALRLDGVNAEHLRHGRPVTVELPVGVRVGQLLAALDPEGRLLGVVRARVSGGSGAGGRTIDIVTNFPHLKTGDA